MLPYLTVQNGWRTWGGDSNNTCVSVCLLSLETLFFHFLCSRVSIFACVSVVVKLNNKKQEHECVQLTIVNNSASAVALLALYKRRGGGGEEVGEEVGEVGRRWGRWAEWADRLSTCWLWLPAYMSTVNSLYYGSGSVQLTLACLPWLAFSLPAASLPPLSLINTLSFLTEEAQQYTRCPLCREKCEGGWVQRKRRNNAVVSRQHSARAQTASHRRSVCVFWEEATGSVLGIMRCNDPPVESCIRTIQTPLMTTMSH